MKQVEKQSYIGLIPSSVNVIVCVFVVLVLTLVSGLVRMSVVPPKLTPPHPRFTWPPSACSQSFVFNFFFGIFQSAGFLLGFLLHFWVLEFPHSVW